ERQGVGLLERADLGRLPASAAEGLVELARGRVAEDAEGRVRVPALKVSDGEDFSVGLELHVLGSLRPVRGRLAPELVRAQPAVAGEARIEVAWSRRRERQQHEPGERCGKGDWHQ